MRLPTLLLTASLLATTTLALPQLDDVRPQATPDVDTLLRHASDPQHAAQGPILALAHAHGIPLQPVDPLPPRDLTLSLLDAYTSLGHDLKPDLIQSIHLSAQDVPLELHTYLTPILDALTHANNLGARLELGHDVTDQELLTAALQVTAATDQLMLANSHEPLPWPLSDWTSPFGLLHLGTPDADEHAKYYWLLIDPHGNDTYTNNAGATTDGLGVHRSSLALDLSGDDNYTYCGEADCYSGPRAGSAVNGIGILIDAEGNDTYDTRGHMFTVAATGGAGLAAVLDLGDGDDWVNGGGWGAAYATSIIPAGSALALYYDEAGDDNYDTGTRSIGFISGGTAVFIDAAGSDNYTDSTGSFGKRGCGAGTSVYLDDGGAHDAYPSQVSNNDTWTVTDDPNCFTMDPNLIGIGTDR